MADDDYICTYIWTFVDLAAFRRLFQETGNVKH